MNKVMVVIYDDEGDMFAKLLLTEEQVRLFNWMIKNKCLAEDFRFQVIDGDMAPIEV